jgi:hypothetical protein
MRLSLRFDDAESAGELAAAEPPEDVLVYPPVDRVQGGESPRKFTGLVIEWEARTSASELACWIAWAVRRPERSTTRINEQDIALTEKGVLEFIESQLQAASS